MCSDALKRRLVFGYRVANNFGLKQLSTIVKSFITKALEYKAVLMFNNNFYASLCIS